MQDRWGVKITCLVHHFEMSAVRYITTGNKNAFLFLYYYFRTTSLQWKWRFYYCHIELVMYFKLLLFLLTILMYSPCIFGWVSRQKKKNLPLFDFPGRILLRIVSLLQCVWQVQPDEIPVSRVTLFPANPRIPLNCTNTKPLWICHLPSLYLGLQAVFPHKAAHWLQAVLSQVFLSVALLQKLKEWSQCYQKIIQYRT